MAEFHDIFCHPFLLLVLLIKGLGGMGQGRVGQRVGGAKNLVWDTP